MIAQIHPAGIMEPASMGQLTLHVSVEMGGKVKLVPYEVGIVNQELVDMVVHVKIEAIVSLVTVNLAGKVQPVISLVQLVHQILAQMAPHV